MYNSAITVTEKPIVKEQTKKPPAFQPPKEDGGYTIDDKDPQNEVIVNIGPGKNLLHSALTEVTVK